MRLPQPHVNHLQGASCVSGKVHCTTCSTTRTTTQEPHQQVDKHRQREDGVQQQQLASRHG